MQAVLVLRWFKEATDLRILARDARVSIATAYRYLHEAIDVIAAQAPDLPDVLATGRTQGWGYVCLDGTLIACTRSSAPSEAGHDVWYSGKHKRQMVLRLLAFNAEAWLAERFNAYLADPDEYRAIVRQLLHQGGQIDYTHTRITITLDRPDTPRIARALHLLTEVLNAEPAHLPGDPRPLTYQVNHA